jgi:spermidine synthase
MTGASAAAPARSVPVSTLHTSSSIQSAPWWYLFFFVSGFPALLYQIVWQRSLFTLYGVNIESVTMVVTAFMLGLGLGSLFGGIVSCYRQLPLLKIFGVVELFVGAYGIASLKIFRWAASFTAGSPPLQTGLVAFTLVAFPTALMGSTLPILVSHTVRISRNVGTTVGELYSVNTLGSAVACFCAGIFLMRSLGEWRTVALAAGLNGIVGICVLAFSFRDSHKSDAADLAVHNAQALKPETKSPAPRLAQFSFGWALAAAALAGFISLGYEIVWYRLFSFTTGGVAKSFAFLLGAYLLGIASGSAAVNRVCTQVTNAQLLSRILIGVVTAANLLAFLVGPILFNLVTRVSYAWALVPIGLAAAGLGAIFPLLCHVAISPEEQVGARMSYVYLSNIVGSALGSYITGFVLMDTLSLRQVSVALTLLGIVLGVLLLLNARLDRSALVAFGTALCIAVLFVTRASVSLYHDMYEKMLMKSSYPLTNIRTAYLGAPELAVTIENRSGEISIAKKGLVFGGGMYDGCFNVSLVNDSNGLERPFSLSYYSPNPKDVLMIGLSSGSWAQVIANHPQLEHLTIVEINPGYLPLIKNNSMVASLLQNPKVHIDIDDGRRWLVRNPGRKFDAIVMNTTYNWRSNISNLLSVEFLQFVRQHLNPGGIEFFNATDSDEAYATAVRVFPYAMRLANFMVVSDSPLQLDAERWRAVLLRYTIDGKPVFDLSKEKDRHRFAEVMAMTTTMDRPSTEFFTLESADHIRVRTIRARIITDDDMGTEWFR